MTIAKNKWEAGLMGSVERCLEALRAGADVNDPAASSFGPPLLAAARAGRTGVVKTLLEHGADVSLCSKSGETALHDAASTGYADICAVLLEAGADPNVVQRNGYTPLMLAANKGRFDVCCLLGKAGARVDEFSHDGLTALHYAIRNVSQGACNELLALGAGPMVMPERAKAGSIPPFLLAAKTGFDHAVKAMIASGRVDPEFVAPGGLTAVSLAKNSDTLALILSHQAEAGIAREIDGEGMQSEVGSRKSPSMGAL